MKESDEQLHRWPAIRLLAAFQRGDVTPVEATERSLAQARQVEGLNAFSSIFAEEAMVEARRAAWRYADREPLGLLDGLPVAVKDSFRLRGSPTRSGSLTTSDEPADGDGPAVAAMRRAGATFVGRTTMPEFGWKAVCDSPLTGITRNPFDEELTPGGSSGGDGVAVATGASAVAIGADIGGSVRIPAAFCGIVAVKPTHNRAPRHIGSHASVLSREGPMARSVADAALLLDVIEGNDRGDEGSRRSGDYYRSAVGRHIDGMTLGLMVEHPEVAVDPRVAECIERAMHVFEDLGVKVRRVDQNDLNLTGYRGAYQCLVGAELAGEISSLGEAQRRLLDPGLRETLEDMEQRQALDLVHASHDRRRLLRHAADFFRDCDLLATPTVPILPFQVGRNVPAGWPDASWTSWTPFTWPFNMTGSPAATVPCGFVDGLPVGLQLVAERSFDSHLMRAASVFERALGLRADVEARPGSTS